MPPIIKTANAPDIHTGDKTHHHDHAMTLVSFSTTNATVSKPTKPIPPELEDDDDIYSPLAASSQSKSPVAGFSPTVAQF
jgi:hypothetical protein